MLPHRSAIVALTLVLAAAGTGCGSSESDGGDGSESASEETDGPGFGDSLTYEPGVNLVFDDPTVGSDGERRWLNVRVTATNSSLSEPQPIDFTLACPANSNVGEFLVDVDTPSPDFPITEPVAEGETSGFVSLSLPLDKNGEPVEQCDPGPPFIVVLSAFQEQITLPDDLAAELVSEGN